MSDTDPLARSRWNVQAFVILLIIIVFFGATFVGLYIEKLDWNEWYKGVLPTVTFAIGWLLRGTGQT